MPVLGLVSAAERPRSAAGAEHREPRPVGARSSGPQRLEPRHPPPPFESREPHDGVGGRPLSGVFGPTAAFDRRNRRSRGSSPRASPRDRSRPDVARPPRPRVSVPQVLEGLTPSAVLVLRVAAAVCTERRRSAPGARDARPGPRKRRVSRPASAGRDRGVRRSSSELDFCSIGDGPAHRII
jgi:hypothetical protein